MVDIVPTTTAVVAASSATIVNGRAGETIVAGQMLYKVAATGLYKLADSDGVGELKNVVGMALNPAAVNQPVAVCTSGDVTTNAAWTAGSFYYLSETAGGIQPVADLSGEDVIQIGYAKTTSVLNIKITNTGVTV